MSLITSISNWWKINLPEDYEKYKGIHDVYGHQKWIKDEDISYSK